MADNNPTYIPPPASSLPTLLDEMPVSLDTSPAAIYLASLGQGSQRTIRTALNTVAGLLGVPAFYDAEHHDVRYLITPWANLRRQHTIAISAQLQERYAAATANKLLAALRRVLREARRLGQLSADDYEQAIDLAPIRATQVSRTRFVANTEIVALLRACAEDPTPAGVRDAAIIALLCGTGLHRAEAVALDLVDYDRMNEAINVRARTKRNSRTVYLPKGVRAALEEWLALRGEEPGPLFYRLVKGGGLVRHRLAGQAIATVCATRAAEAQVPPLTPHSLRRTFITGLLNAGADMTVVQHLAGHKYRATTSRYDERTEEAKRQAAGLVHVPHFPQLRIQEVSPDTTD